MQTRLLDRARRRLRSRTVDVGTVHDALEAARQGFARIPWQALGPDGETALTQHAVTVRCLQTPDGSLPRQRDDADLVAVVARSY
jgi:prolyl-tRNA synthetase